MPGKRSAQDKGIDDESQGHPIGAPAIVIPCLFRHLQTLICRPAVNQDLYDPHLNRRLAHALGHHL